MNNKVSEEFRVQWIEFPHLRNLWNIQFLLQSQGVDFAPWNDDVYSHKLREGIYTKVPLETSHHLDICVSRGAVKGITKYIGHDLLDPQGIDNIMAKAFISLYVPKYNGIISLTFSDKIVTSVSLSPNREIIDLYNKDMNRYLKKYYD